MKEVFLTSSVLILAVFLVRTVFRNTVSRRLQYALWGLVLVRLLLPVNLPAMEHNVLTAAFPMQQTVETEMEERIVYALPTQVDPLPQSRLADGEVQISRTLHTNYRQLANGDQKAYSEYYSGGVVLEDDTVTRYFFMWPLGELLRNIWYLGMAVMVLWFLASNLRFRSKLRGARIPYAVEGCKYPVYLVEEGLPSPCLFGLVKPAIYLTPAAVRDKTTLRHVLAHETTHARHLDPLWAFLRGACLVVYWFNPLVWAAAFASRTDCELACDEGALKVLGEGDRIPYGKTLLSLIPVQKNPASPLLSATTMTSDKKKLTERIKRIAENRQSVHAAIFLVVAIAAVACIMTFTGAKTAEDKIVPLTGEELDWFNTEFFNGGIQNQFLSSEYKSPEYINMFELFYCGTGLGERSTAAALTSEERKLVIDTFYGGFEPDCPCYKISAADIDTVLLENIGMTLAETKAISMGSFHYLADYDAYYYFHGDTNYRGEVVISSGEREGDLVRLYYNDTFFADGWKCVTLLADTGDGYWFVSNLPCDPPAAAVKQDLLLRSGNPDKTVKLSGLTVTAPQKVQILDSYSYSNTPGIQDAYFSLDHDGFTMLYWEDTTGVVHFAYRHQDEDTVYDILRFTAMPEGYKNGSFIEVYHSVSGHSGFQTYSYYSDDAQQYQQHLFRRCYEVIGGELYLVSGSVVNSEVLVDINGDGSSELYFDSDYLRLPEGTPDFYFDQDGTIYGVDLQEVVEKAYPEWDFFDFGSINYEKGCFSLSGYWLREDGANVTSFPELYFTGEEFLFYEDRRETIDHVVEGITVTGTVLDEARTVVQRLYETECRERSQHPDHDPAYDDWRIENLELSGTYSYDLGVIQVYNVNYEFHASQPAKVGLAGGMYHRDDDWVMPGYPNSLYLYFAVDSGGKRLLHTAMANDGSPGVEWFDEEADRLAEASGLVNIEPALYEEVIESLTADSRVILQLNNGGYITQHTEYWRIRVENFATNFTWAKTKIDQEPAGNSLTLGNTEMGVFLRCWEDNNLVQVMLLDETAWYTATPLYSDAVFDGRLYSMLRQWYDSVEWQALVDEIVIENRGQTQQEIAQEWADRYAEVFLNVTSGSQFACTYARAEASIWDWVPETAYPASTDGKERFYFGFTRVFVPETEKAYHYQLAGNTVDYDGSLGEAPEGACMDSRVGPMYLTEGGWRCDGVGTGI